MRPEEFWHVLAVAVRVHVPKAKLLKNGKPSLAYARMDKQVENFKNLMKRLNFKIEQTGFAFTNPKFSGITDVIAHDNNIKSKVINKKRIIIDLKTSALHTIKINKHSSKRGI